MAAIGVRRDKAALSSGCKSHPANALQPEATGAVMEETKWLKPSDSGSRIGDRRECVGRNASERRANLEKDDVQADPAAIPGKADTVG
jgi:predicted transcriptional regulator